MNFFHLDCLASEVRLNVDLDVALTVIANGCYRWLASKLKGFEKAKPKELYRKFVETSGRVDIGCRRRQIGRYRGVGRRTQVIGPRFMNFAAVCMM